MFSSRTRTTGAVVLNLNGTFLNQSQIWRGFQMLRNCFAFIFTQVFLRSRKSFVVEKLCSFQTRQQDETRQYENICKSCKSCVNSSVLYKQVGYVSYARRRCYGRILMRYVFTNLSNKVVFWLFVTCFCLIIFVVPHLVSYIFFLFDYWMSQESILACLWHHFHLEMDEIWTHNLPIVNRVR